MSLEKRIKTIFCLLIAISYTIKAQIIRIKPLLENEAFVLETYQYFNPEFIQRNKIKTISSDISYKQDLKPIISTGNKEQFIFDTIGNLIAETQINYIQALARTDTTNYHLTYINNKPINIKKIGRQDSYIYSYSIDRDQISKLDYYRFFADSTRKLLIFSETFQYSGKANIIEKRTINDMGKAYKEEVFEYNKSELISYSDKLLFNGTGYKWEITYDEYGRVAKKIKLELPSNKIIEEILFVYDKINILTEEKRIDGKLKYKKEFLYDNNMLLQAILIREEEIASIRIYKFNYSFF